MELFSYQACDSRGELVSGTLEAETKAEASRQLRREGIYILAITPGVSRSEESAEEMFQNRQAVRGAKREEVIEFAHQLSVMLEAGVPLGEALDTISNNTRALGFRHIINAINENVSGGDSLSKSLARWPRVFPPLMVSLVMASEASGTLGMMMGRVSAYLAKEHKTAKQVKGALTYPVIMMILAVAITIFLMVFVLPRFAAIYANRAAALPVPTRIMIGISNFWSTNWLYIAVGAVAFTLLFFLYARSALGRKHLDYIRIRMPILGPMFTKLYVTRAARTMATLISSGVDLLETIKITRGTTPNYFYHALWDKVGHDLKQGLAFSESVRNSPLMPSSIVQMIAAGERTGRLGPVLERIGEVMEGELDESVEKATQFIEPAMIGFMGIVIGFVAIAMLLPIFTISNAM